MRKLSSREVETVFCMTKKQLKDCRDEGLKCIQIGTSYYYNYDDVVEFLK